MWIIAVLVVIGFIVYKINSEYNSNVKENVTKYGGILKKYEDFVDYLQDGGTFKVAKVTKDSVILAGRGATWSLDYVGNTLEVKFKGEVPLLGFQKQNWTFPDGFPQNNMIATIEEFIKGQIQQQDQIRDRKLYGY